MKQDRTNLVSKKILLIYSLFLFLFSCKEKIKIVEHNNIADNNISFELPGKRGEVTHHKKGKISPFEDSYLKLPDDFTGTSFSLKHDYPIMGSVKIPKTYPWKKVTNSGSINSTNALDYVLALKKHISVDMEKLLYDYDNWDSNKESWYQSIWLGSVREPIHGMYVGSGFPAKTLGETQENNLTTYVYTLYDKTAAQTLNNIWGTDSKNAYKPNLTNEQNTQYKEGSIIVKFAFINYDNPKNNWNTLNNAAEWEVYTNVLPGEQSAKKGAIPSIRKLKLMQFDIIVKDTEASSETGWVFSTLVYDKDAPGETAWDKMIPLGATWGNNPEYVKNISPSKALTDAIVPAPINDSLTENWINPKAPSYAKQTLGWGGRLSGPNDGAVFDTGALTTSTSGKKFTHGVSTISCLGCHSTAQYKQQSFLIPVVFPTPNGNGTPLVLDPGSTLWNRYFRNNNGTTPFDSGSIALDYDMVTSFKAIPAWQEATKK